MRIFTFTLATLALLAAGPVGAMTCEEVRAASAGADAATVRANTTPAQFAFYRRCMAQKATGARKQKRGSSR
jgi:hypothetical protein